MSQRGFIQAAGAAVALATGSVHAKGKPLVVDVVSVWPKSHQKTGRMDWGYRTDTDNHPRDLYKKLLAKAGAKINVTIRMRKPVTTDREVAASLADLKESPPAGLILTGHTLHTWNNNWKPLQATVNGRGDIPTAVFFNLPNIGHRRPCC